MECIRYDRGAFTYEDCSEKFKLTTREFNRQYASIYAARLAAYQSLLEYRVQKKWGNQYAVKKLVDLIPNEKAVVFGTIYKQQELKPSILREISDEHQLLPLPPKARHVTPGDLLILEDELQRILLAGSIRAGDFVTGVVLALLGYEDDSGKFIVEDICPADIPMATEFKVNSPETRYIALVSGLDLGSGHDSLLAIQEMVFALVGKTGSPEFQKLMSKVSHLIIAGNCLSSATQDRTILDKARYLLKNNMVASVEAIQQLDDLLFQLASSMTVDLMPGAHDPANFVLPQQPLHRCMLPQSYGLTSFRTVSNPYSCRIGGRSVMGTSGQPISDILKHSFLENALDAMEKTLEWRHMCPTAPDTLGCYPFERSDPFIFDSCPDIYFAGNQDAYGDRVWKSAEGQSVRLVSIPRFSETSTIVLVDPNTTECFTLNFSCQEDIDK